MLSKQYGTPVQYKNKALIASVAGKGKQVIVMLPGFGSPSPIIEFKALSSFLEDNYTIVTIDYLGYGKSDIPDTERTLENISDEIHHTLNSLGYSKYILAAHSISGIYCLYYANQYPEEIEAFIGIDTSVPQQIDSDSSKAETSNMLKIRKIKHTWASKLIIKRFAKRQLQSCNDFTYSKSDLKTYADLMAEHITYESAIDEIEHFDESLNRLKDVHFPSAIPVLFLTAKQTEETIPQWLHWHKELLGSNSGKVISMQGNHYLHLTATKQTAEEIDRFLKQI